MTVVAVVSGPDRAGKSTFVRDTARRLSKDLTDKLPPVGDFLLAPHSSLVEVGGVMVRHWYEPVASWWEYLQPLVADSTSRTPVLWDRSWACESVYGLLTGRGGQLAEDPWLGEWWLSRAVATTGVRLMVLGPDAATLRVRAAEERSRGEVHVDLALDPAPERAMFAAYAERFNWRVAITDFDLAEATRDVLYSYSRWVGLVRDSAVYDPPGYAGPTNARVVVLGEVRNETAPRAWLPFTTERTTRFARSMGDWALRCGWTNVADDPRLPVATADLVVACGAAAGEYARSVQGGAPIFQVPHPSALYRWGSFADRVPEVEADVRRVVAAIS